MSSIDHVNVRVDALLYKATFAEKANDLVAVRDFIARLPRSLAQPIKGLIDACDLLLAPAFDRLLEIILALGNYLNGNTARGGVYGFKLGDLVKMKDVRSVKVKDMTLLHYLVEFLEATDPELLTYVASLAPVQAAARRAFHCLRRALLTP